MALTRRRPASGPLALLLIGGLAGACHRGEPAGVLSACDDQNPCRPFLSCVQNQCVARVVFDSGVTDADDREVGSQAGGGGDPSPLAAPMPAAPPPDAAAAADGTTRRAEPATLPRSHLFGLTRDGRVFLYIEDLGPRPDGQVGRLPGFDLGARIGPIGAVTEVEAQAVGTEVNLLVRTGNELHLSTLSDGRWSAWSKLAGAITSMGLANLQGQLWSCAIDQAGRLALGSRTGGVFSELREVGAEASSGDPAQQPGPLRKVDCVGIAEDLEILALDEQGRLWHATRKPGGWIPWNRVEAVRDYLFHDVDAGNRVGTLVALCATETTHIPISRPRGGSAWTASYDHEEWASNDPGGTVAASSLGTIYTELHFIQVLATGDLWQAVIYRSHTTIYFVVVPAMSIDNPFVGAAVTITVPD